MNEQEASPPSLIMRIIQTVIFALLGAVLLFAIVFLGGFAIANIYEELAPALGMIVPLAIAPGAAVIGLVAGAIWGWRRSG
ncbi:MAG: hypothetical protein RIC14_06395 [Filomicrobium sp.]